MTDPATPAQTGLGGRSEPLEIIIDAVGSPAFFGEPAVADDGLDANTGDTGISGSPGTFADRVTSNTKPQFVGYWRSGNDHSRLRRSQWQ